MLRSHAGGVAEVTAEGATVGEVVDDVVRRFPGTASHLRAPGGGLHRFVNLYLNDEDVRYLGGLAAAVPPGAELSVVPGVAGGAC
jgi:molybdopterin converting factor small subunit